MNTAICFKWFIHHSLQLKYNGFAIELIELKIQKMAKKLNKQELFTRWLMFLYPDKRNNLKRNALVDNAYELNVANIDLTRYKTKRKKVILFEYFVKIVNNKTLDISLFQDQSVNAISNLNKVRNKIIKKSKGKIDADSFYLSDKWLIVKRKVHKLYKCGCMNCKKEGVETHIDHILPRSKYPSLSLDIHNLQILCRDCNMKKSNIDTTDYRTEEQKKICSIKYP